MATSVEAKRRSVRQPRVSVSANFLSELGIGDTELKTPENISITLALGRLRDDKEMHVDMKKKIVFQLNRWFASRFKLPPQEKADFVAANIAELLDFMEIDLDDVPLAKTLKALVMQFIKQTEQLNPRLIENNLDKLFALMERGNPSAVSVLKDLHSRSPRTFHTEQRVASIMRAFEGGGPAASHISLILLSQICEACPHLVEPHAHTLASRLSGTAAPVALQCLQLIGQSHPNALQPLLPHIVSSVCEVASVQFLLAKLLGNCAKGPDGATGCDILLQMLDSSASQTTNNSNYTSNKRKSASSYQFSSLTDAGAVAVLVELRILISLNDLPRDRFAAYVHKVEALSNRGSSIAVAAQALIAEYKGISIESVTARLEAIETKVDTLNDKVSNSCVTFEEVKKYVDDNIADVKDFVADVVKKLPVPTSISVVGSVRKTVLLHFECCRNNPGCGYPPGRAFTTETADWSKWIKMGFSLAKLGKTVIDLGLGNPLGIVSSGVDCCRDIYAAYSQREDEDFDSFISKPFLTSTEQDKLISQLEDAGFFETFQYASQQGGWCCSMCMHTGGRTNDQPTIAANTKSFTGEEVKAIRRDGAALLPVSRDTDSQSRDTVASPPNTQNLQLSENATPRDKRKSLKYNVEWQSDKDALRCTACNTAFTFVKRRHHCRICGRVFCDDCCSVRVMTSSSDHRKRACRPCSLATRAVSVSSDSKASPAPIAEDVWLLAEDVHVIVFADHTMARIRVKIALNDVRSLDESSEMPNAMEISTRQQQLTVGFTDKESLSQWLHTVRHNLGVLSASGTMTLQRPLS